MLPVPWNFWLRPRQGSQKITTTFHEMPGRPINSITARQSRRSTALRLRRVVAMLLVLGGSDVCGGRFGVGAWAACGAWTPTKNSAHGSAGSMCHNAQCYEYVCRWEPASEPARKKNFDFLRQWPMELFFFPSLYNRVGVDGKGFAKHLCRCPVLLVSAIGRGHLLGLLKPGVRFCAEFLLVC